MTVLGIIVGVFCLLFAVEHFHSKATKRAAQYNAYVTLREAYQHFIQYGVITNPSAAVADVFPYTNRFSIKGTNFECVLGVTWRAFSRTGTLMAVSRAGIAVWVDGKNPPELMQFDSGPSGTERR